MAEMYDKPGEDSEKIFEKEELARQAENEQSFKILNPKHVQLTINGELIDIKAWTIGQIATVAEYLIQFGISFSSLELNWAKMSSDDIMLVVSLICRRADLVWKILSYTVHKPEEWFSDLDSDVGFELIMGVIEVNKPFFRKLQKLLPDRKENPQPQTQEQSQDTKEATMTGSASSVNSSDMDTTGQESTKATPE